MNPHKSGDGAPLVSVVVPTYNRADYIAETIESVLEQTYRNFEIIVIDDGSTDDTAGVVEPFAPRVQYVWQENSERGASRNHGLRLAKGEYIAFLDSDDLWLPHMLEETVEVLEARPSVGLVYTDAVIIDSEGRELRALRAAGPSGKVTAKLLHKNFISIGRHLIRTQLVREIGGFREERELSGSEDWELWVRLSLRTEFAYLPVVTTKIRTHPGNTMGNPPAMQRSMGRAAQLFHNAEPLASDYATGLRLMDANIALVNAINYCTVNEPKQSLEFLRDAISIRPGIILDPRFGYTIGRLLKKSVGL